jgi:hypothetical protein
MQAVLTILSVGLLGLIIYFAVSPKSSRLLRRAALAALGLIGLSIGICIVFLIKSPSQKEPELPFQIFLDTPKAPPKKGNIAELLVFVAVFMFIMILIIVLAMRGRREKGREKAEEQPVFNDEDALHSVDLEHQEKEEKEEEDSFDIGLD